MTTSAFNRSQITYPAGIQNICDFRLTLVTGTPVMTSSQTGITTLYMTPYKGSEISLYDGTAWQLYSTTERTLSLSGYTASKNYDIWCYNSGGTPTLDSTVWTNDTTRATALTYQNGVLVKTGDTTRRYIGTIRINSSGGQCNWTLGALSANGTPADLGVWNYYNRANISTFCGPTTDSWTYTGATWREWNNTSGTKVSYLCGVSEDMIDARLYLENSESSTSVSARAAFGVDSASAPSGFWGITNMTSAQITCGAYTAPAALGYHYLTALENSTGATSTFYGDNGSGNVVQSGITFNFLM